MDWLRVCASIGLLALLAGAAYGWGAVVCRAARLREVPWAVSAALGVAAWIFLGGILNLTRLAFPWALDAIVIIGWALAAWTLRGRRRDGREPSMARPPPGARLAAAFPWVAVLAVAVFVSLTLVPPRAYNIHDDLLKYLTSPVRMLETGSVFGSPLSASGREALGGQAFLQGFVLAHLPITYVNGIDPLFSVVLALAMLVSFSNRRGPGPVPALLSVALFLAINPQSVNVTALYSGSALALALILLPAIAPAPANDDGWGLVRRLAPPSLLAAALVALKPTFLPFAALQLLFTATADAVDRRSPSAFVASGAASLGLSFVFLAPWLALHAPHYLAAAGSSRQRGGPSFAAIDPLGTTPLFYGDTVLHFTGTAAIAAAVGLALLAVSRRRALGDPAAASARRVAATSLASTAAYAAFLALPALLGVPPERALRFSCATLIAAGPAAFVLGWQGLPPLLPDRWRGRVRTCLAAISLLVTMSFAPGLVARVRQATEHGSILAFAFAKTERYLAYSKKVMSPEQRDGVALMQSLVPRGEPMLAWIATPFHLDFSRNPVFDVDVAGLANPWAAQPPVRYVLWSYRGLAVRSPAECRAMAGTRADEIAGARCAEFQERLVSLATAGGAEVVADDGETVLLRLDAPLSP